ncbi:MAG: hypothetical protein GVY13_01385 [Alphaproteobacteria bacterium]|jgi:hypothetical protein|nr:hypothetical protein [Alphaproteobacteria bacterium]
MPVYVHQVPGRVRIRTSWIARCPHRAEQAAAEAGALAGVGRVEVNARADSIIVHYDPGRLSARAVLDRLAGAGMLDAAVAARPDPGSGAAASGNGQRGKNGFAGLGAELPIAAGAATLGAMFGKALFDAVLHKGVEHSIRTLVGGRRR